MTSEQKRYQRGAAWICDQAIGLLNTNNITCEQIRWSTGKQHYVLNVKTPAGSRFARFAAVCLLEHEDSEVQMVTNFLLQQLVKKLQILQQDVKKNSR